MRIENTKADATEAQLLEVRRLSKKYSKRGKTYAVRDISFTASGGEVVGLLGANGAGKTTTLKCITGMIPITEGEVFVSGHSIKTEPVKAKSKFSFVTDNHSVFVKMTGKQYLDFMSDVYKVPFETRKERYEYLEERFRLGAAVGDVISSYSHGMRQKICMMGSLMHEPELWILDEPMLGLDPRTQARVTEFITTYAKTGHTVLFSTHNLYIAAEVCSKAVIIAGGRINRILEEKDIDLGGKRLMEYWYNMGPKSEE